jgi:hypothetical protein
MKVAVLIISIVVIVFLFVFALILLFKIDLKKRWNRIKELPKKIWNKISQLYKKSTIYAVKNKMTKFCTTLKTEVKNCINKINKYEKNIETSIKNKFNNINNSVKKWIEEKRNKKIEKRKQKEEYKKYKTKEEVDKMLNEIKNKLTSKRNYSDIISFVENKLSKNNKNEEKSITETIAQVIISDEAKLYDFGTEIYKLIKQDIENNFNSSDKNRIIDRIKKIVYNKMTKEKDISKVIENKKDSYIEQAKGTINFNINNPSIT